MFGYVKAYKSEMKIREYECYSAAYCGVCRAMGKCTGQLSRMTLNYDFVFLSLVRLVLEKEKLSFSEHRCIVHPIKKRSMLDICPSLSYSAKASLALAYYKAKDDLYDSKRRKKILAAAVYPVFLHFKKKAGLPELEESLSQKLCELGRLETEGCASLDRPAGVFGELLGEVFSYGLDGGKRKIAYEAGYHCGKFIYAADAADDYQKDIKSGSYNPLALMYGECFGDEEKKSVQTALLCELSGLERAVDLIDFSDYRDIGEIIKNIIYLGMPEQMNKALFKATSNK